MPTETKLTFRPRETGLTMMMMTMMEDITLSQGFDTIHGKLWAMMAVFAVLDFDAR